MANVDDRLDVRQEPSDARLAPAPDSRRPRRLRTSRYGAAWLILVVSITLLIMGMVLPQTLIIAAGLVLAAVAGHLFDPTNAARRRPRPR